MATNKIQGIYLIKNIINGKIYIGQSNNIKIRWRSHRSLLKKGKHSNTHLQRSYDKHGKAAFSYIIYEQTEDLNEREYYWIQFFIQNNIELYNCDLSPLVKGSTRPPRSKEWCENISKCKKGRTWDEVYGKEEADRRRANLRKRNKTGNNKRGKKLSEEAKKRISETLKRFNASKKK